MPHQRLCWLRPSQLRGVPGQDVAIHRQGSLLCVPEDLLAAAALALHGGACNKTSLYQMRQTLLLWLCSKVCP